MPQRLPDHVRIKFRDLDPKVKDLIKPWIDAPSLKDTVLAETPEMGRWKLNKWVEAGAYRGARSFMTELLDWMDKRYVKDEKPEVGLGSTTIRFARVMRAGMVTAPVTYTAAGALIHPFFALTGLLGGGLLLVHGRKLANEDLKKIHSKISETIRERGPLDSWKGKRQYPPGWDNAETIAQTHPLFHVTLNGDLIFHRTTRAEYLNYRVQKSRGFSLGFWREPLREPDAPQSVKNWAKVRLARIPKP